MGLNDSEVKKQIEHMMAFIHQEAKEKAQEIDAKAEEEFNIEKGRLVQQDRLKILSYYEKREKQVDLQQKIQRSNFLNQSRLKVLKSQDEHVMSVVNEARSKLGDVTKDQGKYKKVLEGLITQGLFQLLEVTVRIRCKQADIELVKEAVTQSLEKFKEMTKKECNIKVDEEDVLGEDCCGGVELISKDGKIRVLNTLESRLDLLTRQMLPEIRMALFGASKSRKFFE